MKSGDSQTSRAKTSSRVSMIIGVALLFVMALFWAVDDAIVYITGGAAFFFLFLSYHQRPKDVPAGWQSRQGGFRHASSERTSDRDIRSSSGLTFSAWLRRVFKWFNTPGGDKRNVARVIRGCFPAFIFGSFVVIALWTAFGAAGNNATTYLVLGQTQWENGQIDSARLSFSRAYREDPGNIDAMILYGKAMLALNSFDSALLLFDLALEEEPDNAEAIYNKAFVLYEYRKYEEGRVLLDPLVSDCTNCVNALLLMGDLYYVEKRYEESFSWYDKAYSEGGARGSLLCQRLGYLYDVKQEYQQAVALYEEALAYDSTTIEIYQRLGELLPGEEGNYYRARAQGGN